MSERENKKKVDIEAKLFIALLHLKEEKNKKYTNEISDTHMVYLFDDYDELKYYFETNGFPDISEDLLKICIMKTTKKGTIISLKELCDYTIRKKNSIIEALTKESKFDPLAVSHDRAFIVDLEQAEELKNEKLNPKIKQQIEEIADEFRVNNLVEEGKVLKKTTKSNKK